MYENIVFLMKGFFFFVVVEDKLFFSSYTQSFTLKLSFQLRQTIKGLPFTEMDLKPFRLLILQEFSIEICLRGKERKFIKGTGHAFIALTWKRPQFKSDFTNSDSEV